MGPHSPDYFLIRGEAQKPCFLHFSSRLGRLLQQSAFRSKTTIDFAKSPFIAKPLKKRRSISLKKSTARQQKFFRAPKSHDASILFGKHIANAKDFSTHPTYVYLQPVVRDAPRGSPASRRPPSRARRAASSRPRTTSRRPTRTWSATSTTSRTTRSSWTRREDLNILEVSH